MTIDAQHYPKGKIVRSYAQMIVCGVCIVFLAMGVAKILNLFCPLSPVYIRICEYIGYIGWCATLGEMGWMIRTYHGETPAERLDRNLAITFSVIGIFAFVLSRELVPIS